MLSLGAVAQATLVRLVQSERAHILMPSLGAGAVAQATIAICGSPTDRFYNVWYCTRSATARNLVSAVLPTILVTVWRSVVMPMVLYR